jgi:hypothetical protein
MTPSWMDILLIDVILSRLQPAKDLARSGPAVGPGVSTLGYN